MCPAYFMILTNKPLSSEYKTKSITSFKCIEHTAIAVCSANKFIMIAFVPKNVQPNHHLTFT